MRTRRAQAVLSRFAGCGVCEGDSRILEGPPQITSLFQILEAESLTRRILHHRDTHQMRSLTPSLVLTENWRKNAVNCTEHAEYVLLKLMVD